MEKQIRKDKYGKINICTVNNLDKILKPNKQDMADKYT